MKCQICNERKATTKTTDGRLKVCAQCRYEHYKASSTSELENEMEQHAERSAEFTSAGDYW